MTTTVVDAVRQAGVVGAGGAGFPAYAKLKSPVDTVIVNAAECEPLLRADPYLIRRYPEQLLRGIDIVMAATGASHGIVAIKAKHKETVATLTEAVRGRENLSVFQLDDFYPVGDEHVLVHEVLGRTVPEGGIPPQVGVLVNNVQTLLNVAAAVDKGEPVVDKWVTVTGWVPRPLTIRVPLGTPIRGAIALAGGPRGDRFGVIEGGPMTGRVVADLDQPVTRTTGGLIVLPAGHRLIAMKSRSFRQDVRLAASVCCGCRECTNLCPRNLLGHKLHPDRIARQLPLGAQNSQTYLEAFLCSQCSVCDLYACPMGISPKQLYGHIRRELVSNGVKNPFRGRKPQPVPFHRSRHLPVKRLVVRLGLSEYDVPAPITEERYQTSYVKLPLQMGIGAPAEPVVVPGQRVERGDMVARCHPDKLGVPVHASIAGTVESVTGVDLVIRAGG